MQWFTGAISAEHLSASANPSTIGRLTALLCAGDAPTWTPPKPWRERSWTIRTQSTRRCHLPMERSRRRLPFHDRRAQRAAPSSIQFSKSGGCFHLELGLQTIAGGAVVQDVPCLLHDHG